MLDRLTPGNLRLDLQTSSFDAIQGQVKTAPQIEPWFQLPYLHLPIPPDSLQQWQATLNSSDAASWGSFAMPQCNGYVPTDFDLVPDGSLGITSSFRHRGDEESNGTSVGAKRTRDEQVQQPALHTACAYLHQAHVLSTAAFAQDTVCV